MCVDGPLVVGGFFREKEKPSLFGAPDETQGAPDPIVEKKWLPLKPAQKKWVRVFPRTTPEPSSWCPQPPHLALAAGTAQRLCPPDHKGLQNGPGWPICEEYKLGPLQENNMSKSCNPAFVGVHLSSGRWHNQRIAAFPNLQHSQLGV